MNSKMESEAIENVEMEYQTESVQMEYQAKSESLLETNKPTINAGYANSQNETTNSVTHDFAEKHEEVKKDIEDKKDGEMTELDKYWKAVRDRPSDFTGWTYLLQYVEQENDITSAREAFDAFLERYPYCYGYWKKYTDLEKKNNNTEEAEKVMERGLHAIPLSIDLWLHYTGLYMQQHENEPLKIRSLFDRAVETAGADFRSDRLWDMYIQWEKDQKEIGNVTLLYDKLLAIPTQLYSHHFEMFSSHVRSHHPKDLVSLDEFLRLRKDVIIMRDKEEKQQTVGITEGEEAVPESDAPPGEDVPPGEEAPPGEIPPGIDTAPKTDDEEITALREKIIELRQVIHKQTEEEVSKRWYFEEGIRRPYFHVKPLEKAQLKNWREYLDFEMQNGSQERVIILYERCLIACALYEEFWLKFAKYQEIHSIGSVRDIFKRACTVHLTRKPSIHLAWAAFEERQGDVNTALEVLEQLENNVPGLSMVHLRLISLHRRQGNFDKVEHLYKQHVQDTQDTSSKSFYAIKYARYLGKVIGNYTAARKVLDEAIESDNANAKLYLQLIDLEYQQPTVNENSIVDVFDKAISATLDVENRLAFSQRKLEFLEDFGSSVGRIQECYDSHQKLLKEMQPSKKRKSQDNLQDNSQKKSRSESPVTTNGSAEAAQSSYSTSMTAPAQQDPNTAYNYHQGWSNAYNTNNYGYQYPGWGSYNSHYYQQ